MIALRSRVGWAAALWAVVAVLALVGFTAMHGIAVTDVSSARHVVPAAHQAEAARGAPEVRASAHAAADDVHHGTLPGTPAPGSGPEHSHDGALLGCLIALTGLALVALAKRPSRWGLRKRPRPIAVLLDRWAPASPGLPPGFAQLRLGILRI